MKQSHIKKLIVGNWKMNPDTREEAKALFAAVNRRAAALSHISVIVAPPAPFIHDIAGKSPVSIAAQDVSHNAFGAFTGSVSARQAKSAGASYSIVGHSERRSAGDTNEIVAKKVKEALNAGLDAILCVGENERDPHAKYLQTIREQMLTAFTGIDKRSVRRLVVAYEPVWAVGKSYETAPKPSDIHEMTIYIRKVAAEAFGKKDGLNIPVLYGGSVDLENAKAILKDASVDGLLVGRQSLDPKAFGNIIEYADSI